jgi:AsmA-like C-terminal region
MLWTLPAVAAILLVGLWFINEHWPFRYREVKPLLENVLASKLTITQYHRTYFPHPGFVAIGLTMRRTAAASFPPIGTAQSLTVQGSWLDLFLLRDRVRQVNIQGLHVIIPEPGSPASKQEFPPGSSVDFSGPSSFIEEMNLQDTLLDIIRTNGGRYSFPIRSLKIRNLQQGRTVSYTVDMRNSIPRGHILASGTFGPLNPASLASTPLTGNFTFNEVTLQDVGKVHGTLTSKGSFHGLLGAIQATATTHSPDFAVSSGLSTPVDGKVNCTINGLNGDVALNSIDATLGSTTIHAQGTVAGNPKVTNLDLSVTRGRVQDILHPFVHHQVPITGSVWLHGHVYLAPSRDGGGFLHRLQVDGAFAAPAERATDRDTERSISDFSRRAEGSKDDAESDTDAISALGGPVTIRNGIVSSKRVAFTLPGAQATMHGNFTFHEENVHLLGTLKMDTDISHAATGFKSLLLKPLAPFFKKKKAGAVIPIAVTGTPGNYKVTQDILHEK